MPKELKSNQGKRILIITYYWPPSGGAGVQRWVKFVKYLCELGWEPVVYTPENPESPSLDESLLKDVPENLEVIRTKIWEPFDIYRKFVGKKKDEKINAGFLKEKNAKNKWVENFSVWVRGNFFIPDARKYWIKPSIKILTTYLKNNPVDYIISSGPPHSMHLIGRGLKRELGIPWVADFRDPWTNIDFYKELKLTKMADRKHHKLEKSVLTEADLCVTIGPRMKQEFEAFGAKNVTVITNGYDEEDLPEFTVEKDEKFSIAHIGTLNSSRNPIVLWQVLSELVQEIEDFKSNLEIKLVGKVDVSVIQSLEEKGLMPYVNQIPYLEHDKAILEQQKSKLLLLLVNDTPNAKGILTGKMFEYLSSKTPVLGIGPVDGDAATILNETEAGRMFDYNDPDAVKEYIYHCFYNRFQNNLARKIDNYSRKSLTLKLIKQLESIAIYNQQHKYF